MQRPSNSGGHSSALWDMGNNNYGRDNPFPYQMTTPQTSGGPFKPSWGQPETEVAAQQHPSATLWNSDQQTTQGTPLDQSRSFLGTERWGRESGGAPWGSEAANEPQLGSASTLPSGHAVEGQMFPHEPWLGGMSPATFPIKPEGEGQIDVKEGSQPHTPSEEALESESLGEKLSSGKSSSGDTSPVDQLSPSDDKQSPSSTSPSQEVVTTPEEKPAAPVVPPVSTESSTDPLATSSKSSEEGDTPAASAPQQPQEEVAPHTPEANVETSVGETIEQLQQMNLDYVTQQQQTIAAQLTGYQLAMQQQYALAAQQQMFLPSSYFIQAQPNVPGGYSDPNTGAQFPMIPQYPAYAGWPGGMYPSMLQQQMAAAAVSATSQQPGSSPTSQPNRVTSPSSRPQSPSQQQDGSQQQSDFLTNMAAMQTQNFNAMAMAGYPMIPSAYYDQSGALIINNGRPGGPVRLLAPGPMFVNGSQHIMAPQLAGANGSMYRFSQAQAAQQQVPANAVYGSQQSVSGGSTPVPMSQGFNPAAAQPATGGFGSTTNISSLGIGSLATGIGSTSSTPQRRDSFSDYPKHPPGSMSQYSANMSQFYSSLGVSPGGGGMMSPSPGPLGGMMPHSHHNMNSPPPSMSSPTTNMMLGGNNRMFSAAPGAEAKYRNGSYVSQVFGSSGSSLFPPTRIRPPTGKDMMVSQGRSKLLDDFRNNRLPNPQLHELVNHIVEFSQDQHGSRFIQQKLERATTQEKQLVFNEIIGNAYQLMTDVFGNYVIQKFFEFGSPEHKLALASRIRGHVLPLALQMYGCRVIQKALECIPQEQQVEIVKELNGHLLKCVKDQNGNHVVQKCIECVPPAHLQFIVDGFKGQVVGLSSHTYGCRVVQRILEHCVEEQTTPILEELHQHSEILVKDQYGNYVIQHILEHGKPENKSQIVNELRGKISALSQHKFASNVIEKCVSHSSAQNRAWLIEEVCQEPDALFIMMKDQYANYVVQKMLDVAEPPQKKLLILKIRPHMMALKKFTYGKHIITKLEKFFLKSAAPSGGLAGTSSAELTGSQIATANWVLENPEQG
uniref:Pumilio homolog 2-like n=1 Tax=Phallusia mammillata TaxID=59560 RepID=A0A6F9DQP9_9ASCI|nr:pumilio homolog 2-like [Phallusia mammillata]